MSFDTRACLGYGCFVPSDTRRLEQFGAEAQRVELASGVTLQYDVVEDSTVMVRLSVVFYDRMSTFTNQSSMEFIDDQWTMLTIYYLCWTWFWDVLFTKRGGFRAAVRAAGVLKDVRDACRVRRRLDDELVEMVNSGATSE